MNSESASIPAKEDILKAAARIRNLIHRTPLMTSEIINSQLECDLFFKCENFQKAGAFKSRGATYAITSLSKDKTSYGVCTHSSGNHAQAQ